MIYHLAERAHWDAAAHSGSYARSTLGRSLEDEGFIHASTVEQWPATRARFYAQVAEPLVLLEIDETRLTAPVRWEIGDPVTGERFPHVFGPVNVDAVVSTVQLDPPHA